MTRTSIREWLIAVVLLACAGVPALASSGTAAQTTAEAVTPAEAGAGEGAVLWRAGDHEGAQKRWEEALEQEWETSSELPARERARLAYNVGVAHYTAGEPLRAAALFESAARLAPRWKAAAANRGLARADAGLDPVDRGILGGFAHFFTRGEAEWLALLGGLLLLGAGLLDALRGGGWGRAPWLAILALPVFWTPLVGHLATGGGDAVMVVDPDGAAVFGTPDAGGERLGKLEAGSESLVLDRLPGWVKVVDRGEERWAPADSVLSLKR